MAISLRLATRSFCMDSQADEQIQAQTGRSKPGGIVGATGDFSSKVAAFKPAEGNVHRRVGLVCHRSERQSLPALDVPHRYNINRLQHQRERKELSRQGRQDAKEETKARLKSSLFSSFLRTVRHPWRSIGTLTLRVAHVHTQMQTPKLQPVGRKKSFAGFARQSAYTSCGVRVCHTTANLPGKWETRL